MTYQPWQKFTAGRAESSIFCFRVRWSDGKPVPQPARRGRLPTPAGPARPAAPTVRRGPRTLTLKLAPASKPAPLAAAAAEEAPIPLPGKLRKWLTQMCRGTWSLNRMHGGRVCILGFESSSDYARAVSFLAPNGPWRPSGMPVCAAGRTTDVDAARLGRLFGPVPASAAEGGQA